MKNFIVVISVFQIAIGPAVATAQSSNNIIEIAPALSLRTTQLLGNTVKAQTTMSPNQLESTQFRNEFDRQSKVDDRNVGVVLENYKKQSYNNASNTALEGNRILLKGALSVGGAVVAGPLGAAAGYGLGVGIDKTVDYFQAKSNEYAAQTVAIRLSEHRKLTNSDMSEFKNVTPEKAYEILTKRDSNELTDKYLKDLSIEEKAAYQQHEITVLRDVITQNKLDEFARQEFTQGQIDQLKSQHANLAKFQIQFAKQTNANFNAVFNEQKKIWDNINGIKNNVARNTEDIAKARSANDAIRNFMMGKMTLDEQEQAIDSGLYPDLDPKDKQALKESINIQKNSLPRQLEKVLNYASDFEKLGTKLGFSSEQLKPVSDAIKYGAAAVNIAGSITTGNYFAAVMQVADLFGGGGMDPAAARHAEMMGALSAIMETQRQILKELREGFTAVLKNQKLMMDMIVQLSQQINRQHEEIMAKLTGIESLVWANLALTQFSVNKDIGKCRTLLGAPYVTKEKYEFENGRFKRYEGLETLLNDRRADVTDCFKGIRDNFDTGLETPKPFPWVPSAEELKYGVNLQHNIYDKLFEFADAQTTPNYRWALLSPSDTFTALHNKINFFSQQPPETPDSPYTFNYDKSLSQLIDVGELKRQVQLLIAVMPWYEVYNLEAGRAFTLDEILSGKSTDLLPFLNQALNFIDVAIAQHTLISGDILLPALYNFHPKADKPEVLPKGKDTEDDFLADLTATWSGSEDYFKNLLLLSPVLAQNYVSYAIARDLYESLSKGVNRSQEYRWASLDTDDTRFKAILRTKKWKLNYAVKDSDVLVDERDGNRKTDLKEVEQNDRIHWKQAHIPKGWSVEIYTQFIPMPPPAELEIGHLDVTSTLKELVTLRQSVIDAKTDFTYLRNIKSPGVRKAASHVFMKGI